MSITKEKIGNILTAATVAPLDRDTWIQQGFPEELVFSFLATSEMTNTAVLTRVPGSATTQLIKEKYDLKGFFIKSKSCDWGPMAGFLCRNPAFNKKGVKGIDFNIKYLSLYKNSLETVFQNASTDDAFRERAFLPIRISDDRKKQFLGAFSSDIVYNFPSSLRPIESGVALDDPREQVYGIVASADLDKDEVTQLKSVVMEFLLDKINVDEGGVTKTYWALYHGYVYVKKPGAAAYEEYLTGAPIENPADPAASDQFQQTLKQQNDASISFSNQQRNNLTGWLKTHFNIDRGNSSHCYTVDGIQNPHPPYSEANSVYKNTVTGDYDLFSVWPVIPKAGFDELIRISEMGTNEAIRTAEYPNFDTIPISTRLLIPTVKQFTLELTRSRNIYVEFIPPGGILAGLESQFFGNINDVGFYVAQTLNSLHPAKVNAAFHSDEGGRPNVDEIDYPIAVFLPTKVVAKMKEQTKGDIGASLVIRNHVEFLSLIEALFQKCYISLNHGWLLHLFALLQTDADLTAQGDSKKEYFKKRLAEQTRLKGSQTNHSAASDDLEFIDLMLQQLFTRLAAYQENTQDVEATFQAYLEKLFLSNLSFEGLIETFWKMLTNNDEDKTPEYWKKILSREEFQDTETV